MGDTQFFASSGKLRLIIWEKILANEHIKNMVPEIDKKEFPQKSVTKSANAAIIVRLRS